MLFCNIGYIIGLYILFRNGFGGDMPSYERYISTIALANIAVSVMSFIEADTVSVERAVMKNELTKIAFAIAITGLVFIFPFGLNRHRSSDVEKAEESAVAVAAAIRTEKANTDNAPVMLYTAFPRGEVDRYHHLLYYSLLPYNIKVANFYDNTTVNRGPKASDEMIDEIRRSFLRSVDDLKLSYVYFAKDNPLAGEQLPDFFGGSTAEGALHRINSAESGITLLQIA